MLTLLLLLQLLTLLLNRRLKHRQVKRKKSLWVFTCRPFLYLVGRVATGDSADLILMMRRAN